MEKIYDVGIQKEYDLIRSYIECGKCNEEFNINDNLGESEEVECPHCGAINMGVDTVNHLF